MSSRYHMRDGSIDRARAMRREMSPIERRVWQALRNGALGGHKFRRQQRLGPYFADFCCQSAKLVLEIDGDSHAGREGFDASRTAYLQREGYRVLRVTNRDVVENLAGVLDLIRHHLAPSPSHAAAPRGPLPLPQGERGK